MLDKYGLVDPAAREDLFKLARELAPSWSSVRSQWISGDLDKMIKIRTKRQEIIAKSDPPNIWAILDEAALHRQVGGTDVMRAQKQHLLEVTELNHVTLQIIPYAVGTHWGVGRAFKILHWEGRSTYPW